MGNDKTILKIKFKNLQISDIRNIEFLNYLIKQETSNYKPFVSCLDEMHTTNTIKSHAMCYLWWNYLVPQTSIRHSQLKVQSCILKSTDK